MIKGKQRNNGKGLSAEEWKHKRQKEFEKAKSEKESKAKSKEKLSSKPTFDIDQIERDALNNFEI